MRLIKVILVSLLLILYIFGKSLVFFVNFLKNIFFGSKYLHPTAVQWILDQI